MPRLMVTILVIYSLLTLTAAPPTFAQPQAPSDNHTVAEVPKQRSPDPKAETEPEKKKVDLKKVFDEETKKFNADSAKFDPVKIELEKAKQARKSNWSKRDTAFMVVFAAGVAVLVWLLIKYGKECAETNPPNCNLGTDEFCSCERYEEEDSNRRAR